MTTTRAFFFARLMVVHPAAAVRPWAAPEASCKKRLRSNDIVSPLPTTATAGLRLRLRSFLRRKVFGQLLDLRIAIAFGVTIHDRCGARARFEVLHLFDEVRF